MITLRLDKNGGINKGDIKAFEHDNLSEVYVIQLYKNGAIYDLTNKTVELTIVEKKRKLGDMISLPIYEATEGKVKLEVVSTITKQDGIFDFKLTVKDTTGLIETFPSFQVEIKNDITDSITGEIIQDPNFTILTEGLKALADYNIYKTNALKVPEIEQDIVEINEQLDSKAKQTDLKILENRMNSFTSLNEGSTTGDAELMDGRNGADGKTYSNIGEAIRKQMIKKQDAILEYDTIPITLENGLYNNVTTVVNTAKEEWKYTTIAIEEGINYKISSMGVNGEYSSIVGIDSIGGRYIILSGNNTYIKDYLLKSSDIEKYVSLVINTSDNNISPIIVKKSKQIDIIKYIDDKVSPLEHKKTMLCNANGNACKIRFKYNDTKDCIMLFTDYVNNCFKISHIYLIDNVSDEIVWDFSDRTSDTLYTFINSEWISPYKNLNAINNPITTVADQWTGGSHSIGSVNTNNIKSVKVYCDDVEVIQNVDTKCNTIKIVCTTEVSASNTTATTFEDNRYVLNEIQEWTITPNTFDVNVKFEFLEDCTLGINYGLQTENTGFTKLRHYGDSDNLGLVDMTKYAYGSNKTIGIVNGWCLTDDNGNTLEVLVDTTYKCGNRCLLKADTPTIVTASYGKTYSYIVSEASFKAGDIVEHRGKYKFYCAN